MNWFIHMHADGSHWYDMCTVASVMNVTFVD